MQGNWTSEHGIDYAVPNEMVDIVDTTILHDLTVVLDTSWKNDVCPSFSRFKDANENDERVVLWSEHSDPDKRESHGPHRFAVVWVHGNDIHNELFTSDNAEAAVAVFTTFRFPR